jgi:hypothetical protein
MKKAIGGEMTHVAAQVEVLVCRRWKKDKAFTTTQQDVEIIMEIVTTSKVSAKRYL